jgi:hypothetical protein
MQKRAVRVIEQLAYVPLTQGFDAVIDASDAQMIGCFNWHARQHHPGGNWYAVTWCSIDGRRRYVPMYQLLLPGPHGVVDHVNGNGLDNRRCNLRRVTASQNMRNTKAHRAGKIPGIYHDKRRGTFTATVILGTFKSLAEAVACQREAEQKLEFETSRLV